MLEPKEVFGIFDAIRQVPRPSKHEEQISQWLVDFAAAHGIECVRDEALNVIMRVPATAGYENHEGVILQIHSAFALAGADVQFSGAYAGWKPNFKSRILGIMKDVYAKEFGNELPCRMTLTARRWYSPR